MFSVLKLIFEIKIRMSYLSIILLLPLLYLHVLYIPEDYTFDLRNDYLLTRIFSYFNYGLSKQFYFVFAI